MSPFFWDIAIYGTYFAGLLTLVFFVSLGLEDLWRSWRGKGKHR